ncbi:MAG TPA: hypothetical protein VFD13_02630 [Candidatus Kapabacteria bacterium]|nr:hypothetical protein [Candidatus Kapabacteria bacterium]
MKLTIAFFGLLFFFAGRTAVAQTTPYDSAFLESPLVFELGTVTDTGAVFGKSDKFSCHLGADGDLTARFRVGTQEITMLKGNTIHVYWNIPAPAIPGDSNVGFIHLQRLDDNFALGGETVYLVKEPAQTNVEEMTTIIVPDSGYNAVAVEIAADSGGTSFWLDAITLVQSGVAAVSNQSVTQEAILAGYPNPFEHSSRVAVHIDAPASGRGELLISDALGREVERVPIGELHAGGQDVSLGLDRAGIFFARLLIQGAPIGPPLKLVAE